MWTRLTAALPRQPSRIPVAVLRPSLLGPRTVLLVLAPDAPAAVPALCDRVRSALGHEGVDVVTCDVRRLERVDMRSVDALARAQLAARREGGSIRVRNAAPVLRGLLDLAGLAEVVVVHPVSGAAPVEVASGVESHRETEHREQLGGVEERVDAGDVPI